MAEITVVMPVYNGASYLQETLTSLKQQSFEDFEVLCIDDGSTDSSAEILRSIEAEDARFRYVATPSNLGSAAGAVNFARGHATGTRFAYTSQDDLFSQNWLASLHERARTSGADAILPDVEFYREDGGKTRRISGYHGDQSAIISGRDAFCASLDWSIPGNALWPISFLKETGFHDFGAFSDELTVRSFFLNCKTVAFCDGLFFYRQDNAQAITKKPTAGRLDEVDTNLRVWRLIHENGFGPEVHAPFALRTFRSLIRMRGIIYNYPDLASEIQRIDTVWRNLQDPTFQASLFEGLYIKGDGLRNRMYRRASRSAFWYRTLARGSAFAARLRGKA